MWRAKCYFSLVNDPTEAVPLVSGGLSTREEADQLLCDLLVCPQMTGGCLEREVPGVGWCLEDEVESVTYLKRLRDSDGELDAVNDQTLQDVI